MSVKPIPWWHVSNRYGYIFNDESRHVEVKEDNCKCTTIISTKTKTKTKFNTNTIAKTSYSKKYPLQPNPGPCTREAGRGPTVVHNHWYPLQPGTLSLSLKWLENRGLRRPEAAPWWLKPSSIDPATVPPPLVLSCPTLPLPAYTSGQTNGDLFHRKRNTGRVAYTDQRGRIKHLYFM